MLSFIYHVPYFTFIHSILFFIDLLLSIKIKINMEFFNFFSLSFHSQKLLFRITRKTYFHFIFDFQIKIEKQKSLTWFNFPFVMLNVSNVERKYCKLLSFNMLNCVLENFKLRMWMPFTNISNDMDVAVRSKSYRDNVWIGDLTIWRVARNAVAVVLGHSSWRPIWND